MKTFLTILFLLGVSCSDNVFGQQKGDWQYPQDIKFGTYDGDTSYYAGVVSVWRIKKGDTLFEYYPDGNLQSLSLLKLSKSYQLLDTNKVIRTVNEYEREGDCIILFDDTSKTTAAIGQYENNKRVGDWKYYSRNGKLQKVAEVVSLGNDNYTIKEIDYSSGEPITVVDKTFLAFYLKNFVIIMIIFFGTLFGRVFINSRIYNIENGTNLSPVYFYFPGFVSKNREHSLICTFTFWFSNYKPENRRLVIISNTMSIIALTIFFGLLIGLAVNGELH